MSAKLRKTWGTKEAQKTPREPRELRRALGKQTDCILNIRATTKLQLRSLSTMTKRTTTSQGSPGVPRRAKGNSGASRRPKNRRAKRSSVSTGSGPWLSESSLSAPFQSGPCLFEPRLPAHCLSGQHVLRSLFHSFTNFSIPPTLPFQKRGRRQRRKPLNKCLIRSTAGEEREKEEEKRT